MAAIILTGFIFGALLQYARLNQFNTICGVVTLKDLTVAKTILFIIGLSVPLFAVLYVSGLVEFHVKPFITTGIIAGGVLFGVGMAVLGYCPGTLAVSAGQGAIDAVIGIIGGLLGGFVFSVLYPVLSPYLGANLGQVSLHAVMKNPTSYLVVSILIGAAFVLLAFFFNKKNPKDKKWIITGAGIALLNIIIVLKTTFNRPIGASTAYPYACDSLVMGTPHAYFDKIKISGSWELYFLIGAMLSGLVLSLASKQFKPRLIFDRWDFYKGNAPVKRIIWAFAGGFILIFGARLAGGCTSGHIISGGMQLAFSSLIFGAIAFASILITGKIFYRK